MIRANKQKVSAIYGVETHGKEDGKSKQQVNTSSDAK